MDLLPSPSMSAFTPSGHSAPCQRNCPGCRHSLVGLREEPALPSPVKGMHGSELTSFEKMLWKFCLPPQQLKLLTCLPRSPLSCAQCGGDKAPTCSQGVCAGSLRDAQSGLHVLVFLWESLKNNSKLFKVWHFVISGWSTDNLCPVPATGDSHCLYTLSFLVSFFQDLK